MILLRHCHQFACVDTPTVATIGNFDGFHLGHQEIFKFVIEQSKQLNASSVIISFEPSPKEYFDGQNAPARIYPFRKKLELARDIGFDYFVCLNFKHSLSQLSAVDFVQNILHDSLSIKGLVVGDDFKFGHKCSGDIHLLRKMGDTLDFQITNKSTVALDYDRISSTLIRNKLAESKFSEVKQLMGRSFTISGRVFHGDKKGRTIGFPTANILLRRRKSPISGVFAVHATNGDSMWQGIANVGSRPTINGKRQQLEVHLFECQQDLYGQRLEVEFLSKIRDEVKFPSFEELQQQIMRDVAQAKEFFSQRTNTQ